MLRYAVLAAVLMTAVVQGHPHGSLARLENDIPDEWILRLQNIFQRFQQNIDRNVEVNLTTWKIEVNNVIDSFREELEQDHPYPGRERPENYPRQLRLKVDEVFDDLQSSLNKGEQLDMQGACEDIVEKAREMWQRFTARVQSGSIPASQGSIPETLPRSVTKRFRDYFSRMQDEVDAGRSLDLRDWRDEMKDMVQDLYAILKRRMGRTSQQTAQSYPAKVPERVKQPIIDMLRRMQNEIYSGTTLDINAYYNETINTHVAKLWNMFAASFQRRNNKGPQTQPRFQTEADQQRFEVICRGRGYEARQYHQSMWATTTVLAPSYDEAVTKCAPILLRYMQGNNIGNTDLGKTLPLRTRVQKASGRNQACEHARYTCCLMIPHDHTDPPRPRDPMVRIEEMPPQVLFAILFQGYVFNHEMWAKLGQLLHDLDAAGESYNDVVFHVDVFNNPWETLNRRNEIQVNMQQGLTIPACSIPEPEVEYLSQERSTPESDTECPESRPLGMESGHIENHQITSSSQFSDHHLGIYFDLQAHEGRLHGAEYWATENSNPSNPWIQVDLQQPHQITGIVTQGGFPEVDGFQEWVTELQIRYGDGLDYILGETSGSTPKTFTANNDTNTPKTITFPEPIVTRILRIEPTAWHEWCALRFEILGCPIAVVPDQDVDQNNVAPDQDLGQNVMVPDQELNQNSVGPSQDSSQNINKNGNDVKIKNCDPGITCPRFDVTTKHVDYQERAYSFSRWVCVDIVDACNVIKAKMASYEKLQDYFGSNGNMEGIQMTPTIPLVIKMAMGDLNQQACDKTFTSCMYIPEEHQGSPPTPNDANLFISDVPQASIKFVYPFTLHPTADKISELAGFFMRTLEFDNAIYDGSSASIAFYSSSGTTHYSEIWIDQ